MARVGQPAVFLGLGVLALALAGCGRPQPPDIRSELSNAVSQIGMRSVYPLSETHRLGAVIVADATIARPFSELPSFQETSFLITEDLVPAFERARRARFTVQAANRFPQSAATLRDALRAATTGTAFYR